MTKLVVFGASGMLGSMVLDYFCQDSSLRLLATTRCTALLQRLQTAYPNDVEWHLLDVERCSVEEITRVLSNAEWAINAIGVIKPYIHDENAVEVERAVLVNAYFPHRLAQVAAQTGCRVLQIATDCVYSGTKGRYVEKDNHDPLDVYGKTKSLGEVYSPRMNHLRCSIIGPEPRGHVSLLDWFLRQPPDGNVSGYTNHKWNGVTTLHFAKLCYGVIMNRLELPHVQHVIPTGITSKAELLRFFAKEYRREDVTITPTEAKTVIDRTLATLDDALNRQLWLAAGYHNPPSVPQMIAEMVGFQYRMV
jgi:dTDP-4-dehydrorhamnose reductase